MVDCPKVGPVTQSRKRAVADFIFSCVAVISICAQALCWSIRHLDEEGSSGKRCVATLLTAVKEQL
jgi:hypothetical protein